MDLCVKQAPGFFDKFSQRMMLLPLSPFPNINATMSLSSLKILHIPVPYFMPSSNYTNWKLCYTVSICNSFGEERLNISSDRHWICVRLPSDVLIMGPEKDFWINGKQMRRFASSFPFLSPSTNTCILQHRDYHELKKKQVVWSNVPY